MSPVFIHLHIPRTGGTTLDVEYLANLFSAQDSCRDLAGYGETFIKIRDSINSGNSFSCAIEQQISFGNFSINKNYYSGHMPFGLHKLIPHKCIYVTLIRNPLKRINSYYKLVCGLQNEIVPFENFIKHWQEIHNGQTRYLINNGFSPHVATQSMLKEAQNNLQEHFLYAPSDELNVLVDYIFDFFKLNIKSEKIIINDSKAGKPIRFNTLKLFIDTPEFTENQIQYLLEHNKLDIQLYNWVKETYWLNNINHKFEQ